MRFSRHNLTSAWALCVVMAACGGKGTNGSGGQGGSGASAGSGGGAGAGSARVGVLMDSPVSGVTYETPTRTGVTDAQGQFRYAAGETVSFRVGATVLGEAEGQPEVSPFDLVPNATIVTGTTPIQEALRDTRSPYRRVLNIAVFVQTLDADNDPDNGIEITSEVASVFDGVAVDFDVPPIEFATQFVFRQALFEANAASLFGAPRGPTGAARAMKHLYETLGVDPGISQPATVTVASNGDPVGVILMFSHDAEGNLTRRETDSFGDNGAGGPDGVTDFFDRWTYDRDGNMLSYFRYRGEFTPSEMTTWTYDVYGNRTSETFDGDEDGLADRAERSTYDDLGSLTRFERDDEGDGEPNFVETFEYDDRGNRTRRETDFDGDGMADRGESWEYDDRGNPIRYEFDQGNDEDLETIETFEYDDQNRRTRHARDTDANGTPDDITVFEYDTQGNLVLEVRDSDGDGDDDRRVVFEYDSDGNETRRETDEGADDVAVAVNERTYENGRLVLVESDSDGNGVIDLRSTFMRDDNGNVVRFERDEGADSVIERIETFEYDEDGNQIRQERVSTDLGNFIQTRTVAEQSWGLAMFLAGVKSYELVTGID